MIWPSSMDHHLSLGVVPSSDRSWLRRTRGDRLLLEQVCYQKAYGSLPPLPIRRKICVARIVLGLPDTQEHFGDGGDVTDANHMAQAAGRIQVEVALPELDPKPVRASRVLETCVQPGKYKCVTLITDSGNFEGHNPGLSWLI